MTHQIELEELNLDDLTAIRTTLDRTIAFVADCTVAGLDVTTTLTVAPREIDVHITLGMELDNHA